MLDLSLRRNRLQERLVKALIGLDIAANGLMGGHWRETLSGSAGRAHYQAGKWWGRIAVGLIDLIFGEGHCWSQVVAEDQRRRLEGR